MEPDHEERRLTTILSADVVGYSRLMAADEAGTLTSLNAEISPCRNSERLSWANNQFSSIEHRHQFFGSDLTRSACLQPGPQPCAAT